MRNVRIHRDIKLVANEARRNYLVSEPDFYLVSEPNHTTRLFSKNLLAIETRKTQILMNKPVYLGLSILETI